MLQCCCFCCFLFSVFLCLCDVFSVDGFRAGAWVFQLPRGHCLHMEIAGIYDLFVTFLKRSVSLSSRYHTTSRFHCKVGRLTNLSETPGFAVKRDPRSSSRRAMKKMTSRFRKAGEATAQNAETNRQLVPSSFQACFLNSPILLSQLGLAKDRLQARKVVEKPGIRHLPQASCLHTHTLDKTLTTQTKMAAPFFCHVHFGSYALEIPNGIGGVPQKW